MINFNTFTPERYRDFDLSVAYYNEGFGMVLEIPRPLPRWRNILQPFSFDVWLAIIISLFAIIFLYHTANFKNQSSLLLNSISISQSLLAKSMTTVPESWKFRNFLLIWWVAAWIIELSWICNLIAVLTIPTFPVKIQMKEELATSKYRLCMLDYGEFVASSLKTSNETTLSALGRKLDLVPLMTDWKYFGHESCISKVIAGTHAHSETFSYIKILYGRLNYSSRVYVLQDQLYPSYLTFRFPKHTPWKYKFDIGMQRLYDSGLIELWVRRALEDFVRYTAEDRSLSENEALNLEHLQGSFFLLAFGLLLAVLAVGGEVLSSSRKLS
ncbi:glutamate receptor-like isoform X1 [Macrobrachium rosenbergii]|uniref:glutamate receptor-like isoform X1 n=1 Tax=Macrobrachium rosenbergii TaxID=79674 RepID=UPI0034D4C601